MKRLKALLDTMGLEDVTTYVQSGNVLFRSESPPVAADLEKAIEAEFGIDVTVILRTKAELAKVLKGNPYLKEDVDRARLYVTFLAETPAAGALDSVERAKYAPDDFRLVGRELYLHYPSGYGRTKLSNDFFERKTKLRATTRNWNTVTKLVELAG